MAVTLQCQCIGNLLDSDGVQRIGELFDSTSFVGRYLGHGLLVVTLAAGESSKIWFRNYKNEKVQVFLWGFHNLVQFYKVPGFRFF